MGGAPGDGRCRTSAVTDDRHCPRRRIAVAGTQATWWIQQANGTVNQSPSWFRNRMESIPLSSSTTVTGPLPVPPPRLRSRGGWWGAGSDRFARRNPRPSSSRTDRTHPRPPAAGFVEAARRELGRQRTFRIVQLKQLDTQLDTVRADAVTDAARSQVHQALRAAAQTVLADIDAALRRIEQGSYGRCQKCGDALTVTRLTALPMAALCGSCQRVRETHWLPLDPSWPPRDTARPGGVGGRTREHGVMDTGGTP